MSDLIKAVEALQDDLDLLELCPLCGAEGPFSSRQKHKPSCSIERLNTAHETVVEHLHCRRCNGRGRVGLLHPSGPQTCPDCGGSGSFVQHEGKP